MSRELTLFPVSNSWLADAPVYVAGRHCAGATILSANENPLGCSALAQEAFRGADSILHRYPDGGCLDLRLAIGDYYSLSHENIVCGAGSDELISLLVRSYCGIGDEIVYSRHGFLMYGISASLCGVGSVVADEVDLVSSPDALLSSIGERCKIIFLANPNNPTGTYLGISAMEDFLSRVPGHVLVVLDGAYAEYVTASDYAAGERWVERYENVVMLRTFSKIYGLASLRVGWCYASPRVVETLSRIRPPFSVSSVGQICAIASLGDSEHVRLSVASNERNKLRMRESLDALGYGCVDSEANFLLVRFASASEAERVLEFLSGRDVLVRGVSAYGLGSYLRMTIGSDVETDLLLSALGEFG